MERPRRERIAMTDGRDRTTADIGNIVCLEHVNLGQPDQSRATLFYVSGLGLTRDPYMMTGLSNMWINVGRGQFHLPTRGVPQILRGRIGLVVPDLDRLAARLDDIAPALVDSRFAFTRHAGHIDATCPWGNRIRLHAPDLAFGPRHLGLAYVEFDAPLGAAPAIAEFYAQILDAPARLVDDGEDAIASIAAGPFQSLRFRESGRATTAYDGHHIAIYLADFSRPYERLKNRALITKETGPHEWRFERIIDPKTDETLFHVEHEVRSLTHPMYNRPLVNRNPDQSASGYVPGRDHFAGAI